VSGLFSSTLNIFFARLVFGMTHEKLAMRSAAGYNFLSIKNVLPKWRAANRGGEPTVD